MCNCTSENLEIPDAQWRIRGLVLTHPVSANASNSGPAKLTAVFVADEGAELTTFIG
jgi:hypothetical protein